MNSFKEVSSTSPRNCSEVSTDGSSKSSQLSTLNLPSLLKKEQISSEDADTIIISITQLLEELSSANGSLADQTEYLDIAVEVLESLTPLCSLDALDCCRFLIPQLVDRLKDPANDIDSLNKLSRCILLVSLGACDSNSTFLHHVADVLTTFCVGNSKDFPFKPILERLSQCMETLQQYNDNYEFVCSHHKWPENMRTLVYRFLRTRTELVSDETRISFFCLVEKVVETLGTDWFAPNLLLLLVLVVVVQIRICLDKTGMKNAHVLAVCFHILEMAVHCVEASSLIEDSTSTQIATSVREAALYSIDYWVEAKEQEENLPEVVELILYRFMSCILSVGGAEMFPESTVQKLSPHLLQVFQRSVADGDYSIARLILPCLNLFNELPDNTIILLVDLVISQFPAGEWEDALNEIVNCVKSLNLRTDFYSSETLKEACLRIRATVANSVLYSTLSEMIASL